MNVDGSYVVRRAYGAYQACLIVRSDNRSLFVANLDAERKPKGRPSLLVRCGALGIFATYEEALSRAENANAIDQKYRAQIDAKREALRLARVKRDEAVQAALHPA
jgi:hypothetical protein